MSTPTFVDAYSQTVTLAPDSTALIVVDMQNATGNRHLGLGRLMAQSDGWAATRYRFDRIEQTVVPNIDRLLAAFRRLGSRIIYVTYGALLPDCSDVPVHIRGIVQATNNIRGQPEHDIVEGLTPTAGDLVLNKTTMGAFRSTAIDTHLRAMGIKTLVCVGVSTNNCVAMTAMEACDSQYGVVLVSDGTGTDSEAMQQATEQMLRRLWARVVSTDEVIAELDAAAAAV